MTVHSQAYYDRRVARGAAYLDEVRPDWHLKIDVADLSMESGCRCIVGQLTGEYLTGVKSLGLNMEWGPRGSAARHGLNRVEDESFPKQAYEYLRDAWISEIKDRVNA